MRGRLGEGQLTFKQWHHGYLGLGLWVLGFNTLGAVVFFDDLLQHLIQYLYDVDYQSPLKYLYGKWIWNPLHRSR